MSGRGEIPFFSDFANIAARFGNDTQKIGKSFQKTARAAGDITGADDTFHTQDNRYKTQYHRSEVALIRSENQLELARGNGDDRADFLKGHGGKGSQGFGKGHQGGKGQSQGQDPRYAATEQYVLKMVQASQEEPGSPERAARMKEAQAVLTNPRNGLMPDGPEGGVFFPTMSVNVGDGQPVNFVGASAVASSPEISIQKGMDLMAGYRIGKALTDADIAALKGATAATVVVGTGKDAPVSGATPDANKPKDVVTPPAGGDKSAAGAAPSENKPATSQKEMNQQAQVALERLNLPTGRKNGAAFDAGGEDVASKMDGIIGDQSTPSLKKVQTMLGMEPTGKVTPELLAALNDKEKFAALVKKRDAELGVSSTANIKPTGNLDALGASLKADGEKEAAAVVNEAQVAGVVGNLTNLDINKDKVVSAAELAQLSDADKKTIGEVLDVNRDKAVNDTDFAAIMAAAQKQGITIEGGALNTTFASVVTAVAATKEEAAKTGTDMTQAVKALASLAGTDGVVKADELAKLTAKDKELIATQLDLNGDKKLSEAEFSLSVTAAQATGIKVDGGAAALNSLFANVTFGASPIEFVPGTGQQKQAVQQQPVLPDTGLDKPTLENAGPMLGKPPAAEYAIYTVLPPSQQPTTHFEFTSAPTFNAKPLDTGKITIA